MDDPITAPGEASAHPPTGSLFGDSQPPETAPQVVNASTHASHPFWTGGQTRGGGGRGGNCSGRARGRGSGRGKASSVGNTDPTAAVTSGNTAIVVDETERPQFTGISMRELEFGYRASADGGESSMDSDDSEDDRHFASCQNAPRKKRKVQRSSSSRPDDHGLDGDDAQMSSETCMAAAAFGAAVETAENDDEDEDEEFCEEARSETAVSSVLNSSSRLLPIRGEYCIGCTSSREIVEKIDEFVHKHCTAMNESALYKSAALYYKTTIVRPRRTEGVRMGKWSWKSLRSHYVLHVADPVLQRAAAVRTLGSVRAMQETSLVRVNPDGSKSLDHKGAELLMKVIALQDKTMAALDTARMPAPSSRR